MSADGVRVLVDGSGGDHHVVRDVVLKAMVAMWSKTRTPSFFSVFVSAVAMYGSLCLHVL